MRKLPISLNHLSISKKLYVLFSFCILSLMVIMVLSWQQGSRTQGAFHRTGERFSELAKFNEAVGQVDAAALASMDAIVDAASLKVAPELIEEITNSREFFAANQALHKRVFELSGKSALYAGYQAKLAQMFAGAMDLVKAIPSSPTPEFFAEKDDQIDGAASELKDMLREVQTSFSAGVESDRMEDLAAVEEFGNIINVSVLVSTLFVLILGVLLVQSVSRSLRSVSERLGSASEVLGNITGQLVNSSDELDGAANNQAASINESVAALTEISSTISRTSEIAQSTSHEMQQVTLKAEAGMKTMHQMVESMNAIQGASAQLQNISQIIDEIQQRTQVINDIVFKTQLLAFNASIEAARAGQYGRGFSVVADEVGNLAQLSGTAAAQIQALIDDSRQQVFNILDLTQEKVKSAQGTCREATGSYNEINSIVKSVAGKIRAISDASVEQDIGIRQSNESLGHIDMSSKIVTRISQKNTEASQLVKGQCDEIVQLNGQVSVLVNGRGRGEARA
jgi:methyl-accepting chemotaxis protein